MLNAFLLHIESTEAATIAASPPNIAILRFIIMKSVVFALFVFGAALVNMPAYAVIPAVTSEGKPFPSLSSMIKKVHPAVVNISTFSKQQYSYNPLLNDPFFRRFFDLPGQPQYEQMPEKRKQSAGSGVVVKADEGIVMTNYHVIKDADEVQVSLADGRSFQAKVLGKDPELDIAILKIKASNLTEVTISNSDTLDVGDFVVAIGNPFGLGQTVTTGIVSALGRTGLGIEGFEDFIQTDASINPGNSGGALVNLAGELVGINTAIIAPSGGNVGIGFAIPSNMAKASMEQIVKYGEVRRGQIGVGIQDITSELRQAFDMENGQGGVLVTHVTKGSPAEAAGLKTGDVITAVNGKQTSSTGQLRTQIGMKEIGDRVVLTILRDTVKKQIPVSIGKPELMVTSSDTIHENLKGVKFEDMPNGQGVRITHIAPNTNAAYSGLRPGDVIVSANRRQVTDMASLRRALASNKSVVLLQINRREGSFFVVIR